MNFKSSIILDKNKSSWTFTFPVQLPDVAELILKFHSNSFDGILLGVKIQLDILFHIPGKGINTKKFIVDFQDLKYESWCEIFYLGEFIREIKIFSASCGSAGELEFFINEFKPGSQSTITEEKLLNFILTDNWLSFSDNIRSLSSNCLHQLIANHLNHIQEINGCSTELIEYLLAKQIYKFWGAGVIEIDQVDLAQDAYVGGYNFINDNNLLTIQNYGEDKLA